MQLEPSPPVILFEEDARGYVVPTTALGDELAITSVTSPLDALKIFFLKTKRLVFPVCKTHRIRWIAFDHWHASVQFSQYVVDFRLD